MITRRIRPAWAAISGHAQASLGPGGLLWQDFQIILIGSLVLLALVALGEKASFLLPLRLVLGLACVLLVPGYCLTTVLFPRTNDLDGIERAGLSFGLSLAIVSLLALFVDRAGWGLHLWPILLSEYGAMVLLAFIAVWRRSRLPATEIYLLPLGWRPAQWMRSLPALELRIFQFLAAALVFISLLAAWIFLVPSSDRYMTEFYMLGDDELAEMYPRHAVLGDELAVTMGIVNRERDQHTYSVEVWVLDSAQPDHRTLVLESEHVTLRPGEAHSSPVSWRMPWAGDDQKVELRLFRDNDSLPYRSLRLWVNVRE